jgi:DNA-binding Xre family transcriptional regulator
MKKKNAHRGSDFEDFLEEEGIAEEVAAGAAKRIIAFQLQQAMQERNLSKTHLATLLGTSRAALNRLLDPENTSVTLLTLAKASRLLGKRMEITFT